MRVITSEYLENKIKQLETIDYLQNFIDLSFDEKVVAINRVIDSNFIMIKEIKNDHNSYDQDNHLKQDVQEKLKIIRTKNRICKEYLQLLKKRQILVLENVKLAKISIDNDVINLTARQIKLLDDLLHNQLEEYHIEDLLVVAKYIIKNYSVVDYEKNILNALRIIISSVTFDGKQDTEKTIIGLNSIKCEINSKLYKLDKYDKERIILNRFKSMIKKIINISKIEFMKTYDYKFDIIEYWLSDENNKVFIEKIFERLPDTVNIRSKDNEHILVYILTSYINAFKIELRNQGKPDVSSTYLKNMYKLLMNSSYLELLGSDEIIRQNLLENFSCFLRNSNYKRERVTAALNEIESLRTIDDFEKEINNFDEQEVNEQLSYIKEIINIQNNDRKRVVLTDSPTISIVNDSLKYNNYSYILNKFDSNSFCLKVNVIDLASIINENSPLDMYLHERLFSDINNDTYLIPNAEELGLAKGRKMPTITFELIINQNGEVKDMSCYRSVSMVNTNVNINIILGSENFPLYYQLLSALKKKREFNKANSFKNLEEIINEICIKGVAKYFADNNYPFIYKVQKEQDSNNFENNLNALNGVFYKINKEDFKTIYSIICEDYNYAYYDIVDDKHINKNSSYYTDLLNPLDSYIGIYLQRLIDEFYLNDHRLVNNDYWIDTAVSLVEEANSYKFRQREKSKQKIK